MPPLVLLVSPPTLVPIPPPSVAGPVAKGRATARLRRWFGVGGGSGTAVRPATSPTPPGLDYNAASTHPTPPPARLPCPASAEAASAAESTAAYTVASPAEGEETADHFQFDAAAAMEHLAKRVPTAPPAAAAIDAAAGALGGMRGLVVGKNQVLPFQLQ